MPIHKLSFLHSKSSSPVFHLRFFYDLEVTNNEAVFLQDKLRCKLRKPYMQNSNGYIYQLLTETVWNMGPLDGPPANPTGNINNGAMGFFLAYSIENITAIVPEKDEWIELTWY